MSGRSSLVTGATDRPLIADPIGRHLAFACARWADRPAVVACHQSIRKTYRELGADMNRLAEGLLAAGLEPGDRVALWSSNRYEWVLTQLATLRAGLVFVGLNPSYRASELEYALNKVGCKALIVADRSRNNDFVAVLGDVAPELHGAKPGDLHSARLPHLRLVCVIGETAVAGGMPFAALMGLADDGVPPLVDAANRSLEADTPAAIQFTSGTTGDPKAATLSHRNILNNGFAIGEMLRLTERDRLCVPVQLYHSFGAIAGVLSAITHGAAIVLPDERFTPAPTLRAIAAERCTALIGVPTMYLSMMEHGEIGQHDLSSLRTGIMSCSPCPVEVMRRAIAQMNLREITIAYGMTETSPVSFQSSTDDPVERRVDTVGRILPHLEAKIVDAAGITLPVDSPGELLVRGYSVMLGYWDDKDATRDAVDPEGWIHSGDLATIDGEGYCRIVGRLKDIIIRSGENIAPREIEQVLYAHPAVAEAYVFGVPDRNFGEEVCAWIRLREAQSVTAREIRAFCRGRFARSKVPHLIKFVDAFPVTVTGKVQRFVMREKTLAELSERQERGRAAQ